MATPIEITRDNFHLYLKRSTNPRGSAPDGNVWIGASIDQLQLIDLTELATVDLGGGAEPNPLTNTTKINSLAIYFFLLQEVEADPILQNYRVFMDAVSNRMGKLVGATSFLNGFKLAEGTVDTAGVGGSLGDDRLKISGSGATEFADGSGGNTLIDRVLHGAQSANPIDAGSQPFFMLALSDSEAHRQAATPHNFSKLGDVNELIQTFGSTANGDTLTTDFNYLDYVLFLGVRDYGFSVGEARSAVGAELGAYLQGYALGNSPVSTVAAIPEADVFGGSQVAPFTSMAFHRYASAQTEPGFVEGDGLFTDYILNPAGGTLIQLRAFMDKLMQQDTDQNANTGTTGAFIPKRAEPLYTIDAASGKMVTRTGLYVANVPAADEQGIIQTANDDTPRTRPIVTPVVILLSDVWFNDFKELLASWLRLMYFDGSGNLDFDSDTAVTVLDADSNTVADVNIEFLADMDVNTVTWQSATTVRIGFNGTPDLSGVTVKAKVYVQNAANASNNGKFLVTAVDDGANWIEVTNAARTDAADDEVTDSTATLDLFNYDARLFPTADGWEFRFSYAYDTNNQAGLNPGEDKPVILQVGGLDQSKSITKAYTISSSAITFDGTTDAETN